MYTSMENLLIVGFMSVLGFGVWETVSVRLVDDAEEAKALAEIEKQVCCS
jgi:hypothetical protein